jgi:hypothetical protein
MTDQEEGGQRLFEELKKGYEEYKRNHPDFARVVEEEEHKLKGNYRRKKTHCSGCGEWLEGFDQCSQCGRINK